jgi:2-amino-4-hydroxy-6-hydroxymethyldihydropteridine diphosphokinase
MASIKPGRAVTGYVGLGSNLDDPRGQVLKAFEAITALPSGYLLRRSSLYRTAPLGPPGQPDYVNAVAALETRLEPFALLDRLQEIERSQGRRREGPRWGPRTLDLDLLLYGDVRMDSERLSLPHPQIQHRAFVLVPLAEVAPADLEVPGRGSLRSLLRACDHSGVEPLG